ncbi:MAG TPA: hypothetical protein DEB40_14450 [Elusimicrobia bacterium]|nr:hypothetical protein [Elusimicrobiota bacterium]HBT62934.1 hypothetical protein [Elusimicrobiota bacterium]
MKIAFYHNHKEDIGHMVHLLRIIAAIKERSPLARIFMFQAGKPQPLFERTPGITWLHLPRPFYSKANYFSPPHIPPSLAALRGRFLTRALSRIRPDVLITDFFPFGRRECGIELSPAFDAIRRQGGKIIACVPMPYFTHSGEDIEELVYFAKFYSKILIHTPARLDLGYMTRWIAAERRVSPEIFLDVFSRLKRKLYFTGYVLPPGAAQEPARGAPLDDTILVHRGGGSTSPNIITQALLAKKLLPSRYSMLVAAGPATDEEEMRGFKNLIRTNKIAATAIRAFIPNLSKYIERSAVCVGTAGGTAYELLFYGKKSVVIPFTGGPGARRADQSARADLLERLIGATILDYESLTAERLARAIEQKLRCRATPTPYGATRARWFEGGARSAEMILSHAQSKD